jgi:nucleoside-diphosphate-sugar epimerase
VTCLLVVGGNGFIGRHVAQHAVTLGWEVTCLGLNAVKQKLDGVTYVTADVTDSVALKKALRDGAFDYVVGSGGYIDHTPYSKGGKKVFDAHFLGTRNLVELLDRACLKCFINFGSSDEYGNAPAPQAETLREAPISPYALGKTAAAHFLQMLYRTEKFPAVTLRLFLTYGPGQDNRRFLPQIIRGCLNNTSFPTSAGEQLRDFCYIDDMVEAVFLALAKKEALGEVINIASGAPVSIKQVIEELRQMIGTGNPKYGEIAYRPSENMTLYADIAKAKQLLGWKPKISLEAGLQKTIAWVKQHG